VAELHSALATGERDVPVCWDEAGPPSGHGDRVWSVARTAWLTYEPEADWHVLIQDDAVPCRDFLAGLQAALDQVPTSPSAVLPYLGQGRTVPRRWGVIAERADQMRACWVRSHKVMWGVCIAVPTKVIPEMVAWCDRKGGMPDDMRVGRWFEREALDVYYTWPSLVDHRQVPSLTKHRAADRTARRHHSGSAMDIDWTGPMVTDPMTMRHRPRSGPRGQWDRQTQPVRSVTPVQP
jgi:hypothetical protein